MGKLFVKCLTSGCLNVNLHSIYYTVKVMSQLIKKFCWACTCLKIYVLISGQDSQCKDTYGWVSLFWKVNNLWFSLLKSVTFIYLLGSYFLQPLHRVCCLNKPQSNKNYSVTSVSIRKHCNEWLWKHVWSVWKYSNSTRWRIIAHKEMCLIHTSDDKIELKYCWIY